MTGFCAGMIFQIAITTPVTFHAPVTPMVVRAPLPPPVAWYASQPIGDHGRVLTDRRDCALYALVDGDGRPWLLVYPEPIGSPIFLPRNFPKEMPP